MIAAIFTGYNGVACQQPWPSGSARPLLFLVFIESPNICKSFITFQKSKRLEYKPMLSDLQIVLEIYCCVKNGVKLNLQQKLEICLWPHLQKYGAQPSPGQIKRQHLSGLESAGASVIARHSFHLVFNILYTCQQFKKQTNIFLLFCRLLLSGDAARSERPHAVLFLSRVDPSLLHSI